MTSLFSEKKKILSYKAKIKNQPERMKEHRATGRHCNKISYNKISWLEYEAKSKTLGGKNGHNREV